MIPALSCSRSEFSWRTVGVASRTVGLVLGLLTVWYCGGQQRSSIPQPVTTTENAGSLVSDWTDFGGPYLRQKRMQQLNAAQHKALVSDTDKLLKLASELNAEIGNGNASSLSLDQLRKVAEIEKLAHSVKDKMSQPVKGLSNYDNQIQTLSPQ